jgi:hypothetical protein
MHTGDVGAAARSRIKVANKVYLDESEDRIVEADGDGRLIT